MYKHIFFVGCAALAIAGIPNYLQDLGKKPAKESVRFDDAVAINSARDEAARTMSVKVEADRPNYVTGQRQVEIPMNRSGHFEADFRINGRSVHGLVDTGATYVTMNVSTARRLGIHPGSGDFRYRVSTANGHAKAARIMLDDIEIGSIAVRDVEAFVMEDSALSDTLVGMSFMSKLASYRVEGRTLKLEE